jgi:glucan 1,3-beta-glucosidase
MQLYINNLTGLYYLDRLVKEWAIKYNVAVLICIHAAKGSQNGNDHSSPAEPGQVYWSQYPENIDNTIEVARFLADRYRATPSFLGVELLNEPTSVDVAKLKDYYISAYDTIRKTGNDCILITSPILWEQNAGTSSRWENFMPSPCYTNVWHDWHKYLIWGFEDKPANWIMNDGVALIAADIAKWTGSPLIMGEWSLASAAGAKFTDVTLKQYANNMISKMNAMKAGWTMWTWKQEVVNPRPDGQGGWSMKDLIKDCIMNPKMWDSSSTLCP